MNETAILEIFTQQNISIPFVKLIPDTVQQISKHITSILYNSLSSKSTSHKTERLNLLLLLQKWGSDTVNHLKINLNNYDCFVHNLTSTLDKFDDVEENFVVDENDSNITKSVSEFYKKLTMRNEEKQKLLDIIRTQDKKRFQNNTEFDFEFSFRSKLVTSNDFDQLNSLLEQRGCIESCDFVKKQSQSIPHKEQINLACSLLNLNRTDADMNLLSIILKSFNSNETLESYEIEFINYLWKNYDKLGIPEQIPLILLKHFKFIYEKCFITLCTNKLKSNAKNIEEVSADVKKILKFSSKDKRIYNNIISLLYELYAYSDYNDKLGSFITLLDY